MPTSWIKALVAVSLLGPPWLLGVPGRAVAAPFANNGLIAFHAQFIGGFWDDSPTVYTVDPSGTELQRRFEDKTRPAWSPDGTRLAFEGVGIDVADADGSSFEAITRGPDDFDIAWAPDGSRFAFVRFSFAGDDEVFLVNADGTGVRQITFDEGDNRGPSWSPDGRWIAFVTWDDQSEGDLFVLSVEDLSVVQLTHTGAHDERNPSFSPDGSRIAFDSDASGSRQVYVMNADGSEVRQLTRTGVNGDPAWSPDGRMIAFAGARRAYSDIWVMNADGTGQRSVTGPITRSIANEVAPHWQPLCSIQGTPGGDVLTGTPHRDLICGAGGRDVIHGMGGDDVLFGGEGDDRIWGGSGDDIVVGERGWDRLYGGGGSDLLTAKDGVGGNDKMDGGPGTDRCRRDPPDLFLACE